MVREFQEHDHEHCISDAMASAEARCAERSARFTPVRRRVLEILLEEHRALGAYDILERLRAEGFGSQPPVAYRALDFLVSHGRAHRIERLNAFVACTHGDADHVPAFLICGSCDAVAEPSSDQAIGAISNAASKAGFQVDRVAVEVQGTCEACAEKLND